MAIDIKLPLINGKTDAEQIYQIKRYLYQFAEELKYNLNTLEAGTSDEASIEKEGIIDSLNKWRLGIQGDIGSIATIRQTVSSQGATITSLTEWRGNVEKDVSSIASIEQRVTAAEATIETLTKINEGDVESLANIVSKVTANEANIAALTEWKNGTIDNIASIDQRVSANASSIISLTEWKNGVVDSIAKVDQISDADYASITGLAKFQTDTNSNFVRVEGKADANAANITSLTEWRGTLDGVSAKSVAEIKQTAESNQARIEGIAKWESDVSSIASIKALAEANKASIGLVVDNGVVKGSILIDAINGESVAKISADRLDIEGKTLNIKVDAANISGALKIGQLPGTVAQTGDIPKNVSDLANDAGYQTSGEVDNIVEGKGYQTASGVVSIVNGRITADYIALLGLEVGNQIKMGANAMISWDNVDNKPTNLATKTDVSNAQSAAISSASVDATSKASAAEQNAINTAKSDATTKANDAKIAAINEVKNLGYQTSNQVKTVISESEIRTDQIKCTDLNAFGATIGGFTIDNNSIHTRMGTSDRILLCSGTSASYTVNGYTSKGWTFLAGSNFGVLKDGSLYAKNANIDGFIKSTSGNVGGWNISEYALYYGGSAPEESDMFLAPQGYEYNYKIAGVNINSLCVKVKDNFGIGPNGYMYCAEGYFGHSTKAETRLVKLTQGKIQIKSKSDKSDGYTRYPLLEFYDGSTLCTLVARKIGNTWDLVVLANKNSDDFITTV